MYSFFPSLPVFHRSSFPRSSPQDISWSLGWHAEGGRLPPPFWLSLPAPSGLTWGDSSQWLSLRLLVLLQQLVEEREQQAVVVWPS